MRIRVTRSTEYLDPTRIQERAESSSYATDSKGCVICPSTTPKGPTCGSGEESLLTSITCDLCPKYYCLKIDDGSSSGSGGSNIGAIVGGVVGGVAAVLIASLLYYFLVWKKKHPTLEDDEDIVMSDYEYENEQEDKEMASNDSGHDAGSKRLSSGTLEAVAVRPRAKRNNSNYANRRLSSYESFTRPQAKSKNQRRRVGQRQLKSRNLVNNMHNNSPYIDPGSSNRNSIATTISTTDALNILPIAYIPGVTVRPTKNNTKSIYSYETDSIFSDLNTIENASIIGDIMRANYNGQDNAPPSNTMTAIKAQPKLVSVDRIEEEKEDELSDDDEDVTGITKSSVTTSTHQVNNSTLSNLVELDSEADSDSDVDSDIGEIQRATSIRRNNSQVRQVAGDEGSFNEIPLDIVDLGRPGADVQSMAPLSAGLFVLDVEIDNQRPQSHSSGERSPFEDP